MHGTHMHRHTHSTHVYLIIYFAMRLLQLNREIGEKNVDCVERIKSRANAKFGEVKGEREREMCSICISNMLYRRCCVHDVQLHIFACIG